MTSWRFGRVALAVIVGVLLTAAPTRATVLTNSIEGVVSKGKTQIPYRLFEPELSSPNEKVPLILFLHSAGDKGTDNVTQTFWMANLQANTAAGAHAAYVLAPQLKPGMRWDSSGKSQTLGLTLTMRALDEALQLPNVDPTRIYVTGVSQGSRGAWDILRRFPKLFAAGVPMSYGGDPSTAKTLRNMPIWAFHGSADPVIPVSTTRKMIAALRAAGGAPRYTEIPGAGHYIWYPLYNDPALYDWLFAQHTAGPTASARALLEAAPVAQITPSFARPALAHPLADTDILVSVPEPCALTFLAISTIVLLTRYPRVSFTR